MKKPLLFVMMIFLASNVMAQDAKRLKEVGLVFSSFNGFGLTYRTGTEQSLWRMNTLLISGHNMEEVADSVENNQKNGGFGINFGREYRKSITDDLQFRIGADVSFRYTTNRHERIDKSLSDNDWLNERTIYQPGLNLVLGLNYSLGDHVVIGAELLPAFTYMTGSSTITYYYAGDNIEDEADLSGFSYGISNTSAMVSVAVRFHK